MNQFDKYNKKLTTFKIVIINWPINELLVFANTSSTEYN